MAQTFQILVFGNNDQNPIISEPGGSKSGTGRRTLRRVINYFLSLVGGARRGTTRVFAFANMQSASGTITLSSASGSITATVNGVANTVTASGGDTATATALANAINNGDAANFVSATSSGAVVTVKASLPGPGGNMCTLAASGTGATASGSRLSGGSAGISQYNF